MYNCHIIEILPMQTQSWTLIYKKNLYSFFSFIEIELAYSTVKV